MSLLTPGDHQVANVDDHSPTPKSPSLSMPPLPMKTLQSVNYRHVGASDRKLHTHHSLVSNPYVISVAGVHRGYRPSRSLTLGNDSDTVREEVEGGMTKWCPPTVDVQSVHSG